MLTVRSRKKPEFTIQEHARLEDEKSKETAALVVSVAAALRSDTTVHQQELRAATDQAFDLTMKRFDTIEDQNAKQISIMEKHIEDDKGIHDIVKTHKLYWKLLLAPLAAIVTGTVGWILHTLLR
jgi:uncharacterized protein (DUF3084 family)